MLKKYSEFYKWWTHPAIQANPQYDQLAWQALITQFFANSAHFFIISLGWWFDYKYAIFAGCLGLIFSTSSILLFRYISQFSFLSYLSSVQFLLVLFLASYGDGGVWSFYSIYYIFLVWWSFYFSQRMGFIFSLTLTAWLLFWTYCEYTGFDFPEVLPLESRYAFRAIYISMALSVYIVVFWLTNKNEQRIRQQLSESQQQLIKQEKMASLGQLTAGIAHEINNPINFINGSSEALAIDFVDVQKIFSKLSELEKSPGNSAEVNQLIDLAQGLNISFLQEEINKLIENIKEGSDRVSEITNGLKLFTHQSEESVQEKDILVVLELAVVILNHKIKSKDIQIIKKFNPISKVLCHAGKLNQVFVNIIDNAIDAMARGGVLSFEVYQEKKQVIILIQDNGKGMEEATQKRIFDPFFTTKEVGKGTGLGMSISYGIIKDHGGEIKIQSSKNKGTKVEISLPPV